MPNYLRAYRQLEEEKDPGKPGDPIRFIASTSGIKRDGLDLNQNLWVFDNYRRNPVFLWVHDYWGENLPLGRAEVIVEDGQLVTDVFFDQEDEFARKVESKYRRKFLNAVSIGWDDLEVEGQLRYDLLDISGVPVPGDPDALMERQRLALRNFGRSLLDDLDTETEQPSIAEEVIDILTRRNLLPGHREAIPPHTTDTVPEDTAWDGPGEVAAAEADEATLRQMHAWVDSEADPDTKRAYKLPHHLHTGEAVWHGVAAAMTRLMQEDTDIPDEDRRGVYNHLARHYEAFDRDPPEFRTVIELAALNIRDLFRAGEPEMFPELFPPQAQPDPDNTIAPTDATGRNWFEMTDQELIGILTAGRQQVLALEQADLITPAQARTIRLAIRAGAVLSKRNREDLEKAIEDLAATSELIGGVLDRAGSQEPDDGDRGVRGRSLAALLNRRIDDLVDDETSRSDIVQRMADAAGISAGTVNQILNAEIDCPPLRRLQGFARALDLSLDSIIDAAERDGCEYERQYSIQLGDDAARMLAELHSRGATND